jgi:FtsP/CotA-like multicopper oxidase with cupredoxin domain
MNPLETATGVRERTVRKHFVRPGTLVGGQHRCIDIFSLPAKESTNVNTSRPEPDREKQRFANGTAIFARTLRVSCMLKRRDFLKTAGAMTVLSTSSTVMAAAQSQSAGAPVVGKADYTIRIARTAVELAAGRVVNTTTYNGQFPGPLLRLYAGRPIAVDFINETDVPEQFHWHGQLITSAVDGASEERTPYIPARGTQRIRFAPGPSGFRFYHTHVRAGGNLQLGQYTGEVGPLYIEPRNDPGRYDREVFLVLKEFSPSLSHGGDMTQDFLTGTPVGTLQRQGEAAMRRSLALSNPKGYEVGYQWFSINGRMLGHGEPVRVKGGGRVLFHVLNGSATEIRSLALPGHEFTVVALDGNPVPVPVRVPVLWIGTAERVDAIVEMNEPGVWILGDTDDGDRTNGMGIVVEYAGSSGNARWSKPPQTKWDYTRFGHSGVAAPKPDEIIDMLFEKRNAAYRGFNVWTINGQPYAGGASLEIPTSMDQMKPMFHFRSGWRYRLRLRNASDDIHPIHLHRHLFELTKVAGKPTSGVMKDVVMLGGYQEMEIDVVADNPGLTLFHCHQQLHMDFGLMALFDYV